VVNFFAEKMIRFRIATDAVQRVDVTYSPLLETVLSLHVLASPRHHALQHGWVRSMRGLSAPVKRELAAFSWAFRHYLPDFGYVDADSSFDTFDAELERRLAGSPATIAFAFLRPLYDHGGRHRRGLLVDEGVRRHALQRAKALGGDARVAALLFDDPRSLARRFGSLLRAYWDEAFAAEWKRLEPQLAATVSDAGRRLAGGDAYRLLADLAPRVRVDRAAEEVALDYEHDHTIEITDERPLTLVPSAYTWPHVHVNCDEPWPLAIVYPAPFVVQESAPRIPDADLLRLLRALGDDTRLRALRLIAERPRSTQELAPLVGISEAGLSKHLRLLASAGILRSQREGYYVLYELDESRLGTLGENVTAFLRDAPRRS
jgi:DNA-binding transcriptional ArsR family regulator